MSSTSCSPANEGLVQEFTKSAGLCGWKDPEGCLAGQAGGETTDKVSHQEEAWTLLGLSPPRPSLAQHLAPSSLN